MKRNAHICSLIVLSGPSASGKNVVVDGLLTTVPRLAKVITATTRPRRPGERNGRDYFFVTEADFKQRIRTGAFLEWAVVHGNYYGTLKSAVSRIIERKKIPLLVIDVQGGMAVRESHPAALLLFLLPTPKRAYFARLKRLRGADGNLKERIHSIERELRFARRYDVVVRNREGHLPKTIATVGTIVAEACGAAAP